MADLGVDKDGREHTYESLTLSQERIGGRIFNRSHTQMISKISKLWDTMQTLDFCMRYPDQQTEVMGNLDRVENYFLRFRMETLMLEAAQLVRRLWMHRNLDRCTSPFTHEDFDRLAASVEVDDVPFF